MFSAELSILFIALALGVVVINGLIFYHDKASNNMVNAIHILGWLLLLLGSARFLYSPLVGSLSYVGVVIYILICDVPFFATMGIIFLIYKIKQRHSWG